MEKEMSLELEMLVTAWDNYKKNVIASWERARNSEFTLEETNVETAINGLIAIQPSVKPEGVKPAVAGGALPNETQPSAPAETGAPSGGEDEIIFAGGQVWLK